MQLYLKQIMIWVIIASFMLSGCIPKEGTTSAEGHKTNELVLAVGSEPEHGFDPTTGWGRYGSPLFQSTLLKLNHELGIEYDLATGYTLEQNGTVWIITLRDDVAFSDGTPLTSASECGKCGGD